MYENQFSSRIGERTFRNGTNTMLFRSYKMDQQDQFYVLFGFLFLFELDDQMHELCRLTYLARFSFLSLHSVCKSDKIEDLLSDILW